jgi:hypothetical protein
VRCPDVVKKWGGVFLRANGLSEQGAAGPDPDSPHANRSVGVGLVVVVRVAITQVHIPRIGRVVGHRARRRLMHSL